MAQSVEHKLTELYLSNLELIGEGFPAAVNRLRNPFIEQLRLGQLPGPKDEGHHLTDVRGLYDRDWEWYFTPPPAGEGVFCGGRFDDGPCYRVEAHNGFTDGALHTTDEGIAYGSLRAAASRMEEIVARHYGRAADPTGHPLAGLNAAFMQDGAFIYIPEGVTADRAFVADFGYSSPGEAVGCFSRLLVVAEKGAAAQVVVLHRSADGAEVLANHTGEIFAEEGARLDVTEFSCVAGGSVLLHEGFLRQQADSNVDFTAIALGAAERRSYRLRLEGPHAGTRVGGLSLATGESRKDVYLRVEHLAPDCRSHEMMKCVASGQATGSFTGRVYVAPGAQRTEALQQSRNIELSPGAKIYTRPQLEIYADDVKCSHGATVGQLDAEAVYYMRQRGIDLQTARRLQLEGFITDITARDGYGSGFLNELAHKKIAEL